MTHDDDSTAGGRLLSSAASSVEEPPDEIEELAENCRQYVLQTTGVELDYTGDTLPLVDHYVTGARASVEQRPELEPLIVRAVGAYFGEVVRRTMPSFWALGTPDVHDWKICARSVYLAINPIGVAYDALAGGVDHDGPSSELVVSPGEREIVARRLEELPDVAETEYYLLTTRLEVIEAAAMALRLDMQREGREAVSYTESDYDDSDTD